jgi:hypothetical protein
MYYSKYHIRLNLSITDDPLFPDRSLYLLYFSQMAERLRVKYYTMYLSPDFGLLNPLNVETFKLPVCREVV